MAADTKRGAVDRGWAQFERRLISLRSFEWIRIPMFMVREELARHGLHVVTAADKAVLDACAAMTARYDGKSGDIITTGTLDVVRTELARREAAK